MSSSINEKQIRTNADINIELWKEFVRNHPSGNIFQTAEMYDVYLHTDHNEPIAIACLENNSIIGIILAVIVYNGPSFAKALTSRSLIIGGPLVKNDNQSVLDLLLLEYKKRLPHHVVYTEIRPIFDPKSITPSLINRDYFRQGHYNLMMDISSDLQDLWNNMHKERRRNVRKAQGLGLVFKEISTPEEIDKVITLIRRTYNRKRVPLSYEDTLKQAFHFLSDHIRFFAAYHDEIMIAGQIRLYYKNLAYAWFAGSDETYFKMYPNDFLMWNVISWSHEHGYSLFDFGGGGEPGIQYGVRDYKLKYGCEMFDYGRFLNIHHPFLFWMGKTAVKVLGMKK